MLGPRCVLAAPRSSPRRCSNTRMRRRAPPAWPAPSSPTTPDSRLRAPVSASSAPPRPGRRELHACGERSGTRRGNRDRFAWRTSRHAHRLLRRHAAAPAARPTHQRGRNGWPFRVHGPSTRRIHPGRTRHQFLHGDDDQGGGPSSRLHGRTGRAPRRVASTSRTKGSKSCSQRRSKSCSDDEPS
jgi:hypothetical protein